MKAMLVHSTPFKKYDNEYYSNAFSYDICKERYLRYFNELHLFGRVEETNNVENISKSSGPNVIHNGMANLLGPLKLLKQSKSIFNLFYNYFKEEKIDVLIARIPSEYSLIAIKAAKELGVKIAVEMVGDPFDATWNHGSIKGKVYAPIAYLKYRKIMNEIDNAIFVTENYLQNRYKKNYKEINSTNISNVNLERDNYFDISTRLIDKPLAEKSCIKVATIGSYTSKYKGYDTAIEYIKLLRDQGYNLELHILGTGNRKYIDSIIKKNNLESFIILAPSLKGGSEVFAWLDKFDYYIQPSLTEGLPRGLIEAMSRGLPAIATNVGGIPELLNKDCLVNIKSPHDMKEISESLINNVDFYNINVKENYETSKLYTTNNLMKKRDSFWKNLLKG